MKQRLKSKRGVWWNRIRHKAVTGQAGKVTLAIVEDFGRELRNLKENQLLGGSAALAESLGRNKVTLREPSACCSPSPW